MKLLIYLSSIIILVISGCAAPIARSMAYKGIYSEKPLSILIMPPIDKTTNVDAKEYFYSTLNVPLDNKGYYVIPPFLSSEILKKESAYDSELFFNGSLTKFGEVFGADAVLFTIISKWDKHPLGGVITLEVEYVLKSAKTNEVLYDRHGVFNYNTYVSSSAGGLAGVITSVVATGINTAVTKYIDVARKCNLFTFKDFPEGKYSPLFGLDGQEHSGKQNFKANLNANSK